MATYPSAIKSFTTLTDNVDDVLAAHPNDRGNEITAIETELGTLPKGSDSDVKTRLNRMDKDFGTWTSKSNSTAYQASTDGFVVAHAASNHANAAVIIKTDSSNPPTTVRNTNRDSNADQRMGCCCPVKASDYYETEDADTVYFLPID